jgi:hypothetical protein
MEVLKSSATVNSVNLSIPHQAIILAGYLNKYLPKIQEFNIISVDLDLNFDMTR